MKEPRGPMGRHGRGMSGEKAKNFKGAMKRLFIYMERYRIQLFNHAAVCGRKHHF